MTFEPPRDLHPTNHSPRAVRHPWGKCPNDLGGVSRENADVPQKIGKRQQKNKLATLFPSCFWDVFGVCWYLDSPFFLEKKKLQVFQKKELGIRTFKMMCWVVRYKTNHSFDFSLSGRPGPSSPILRTPSFGGQTLTFACPATTCWKQVLHFAGKKIFDFFGGRGLILTHRSHRF